MQRESRFSGRKTTPEVFLQPQRRVKRQTGCLVYLYGQISPINIKLGS